MKNNDVINAADYPTIQDAVNVVPKFGTLYVPAGDWQTDAFELKSDMTLHLARGAKLIAPTTLEKHKPWRMARETSLSHYFIGMFKLNNVTIEGEGTIECSGHNFWTNFDNEPSFIPPRNPENGTYSLAAYKPQPCRPVSIMAIECRNIKFKDFTIQNSASYTIWTLGCDHVHFDSITLDNHRRGPNTDGLDIDCCSHVWIKGCYLSAGDDCIALKSDTALLGYDKKCEHIIITNNILTGLKCAVRLGYEGDGTICDTLIANNVIHDANVGVDMLSIVPADRSFGIKQGTRIERIIVDDLTMNDVNMGFKLWSGASKDFLKDYQGFIRNVSLRNMFIEACNPSWVGGEAVSNIQLENIRMHVKRLHAYAPNREAVTMPNVWGHGYLKNPLSIYKVDDLQINNVKITEEYKQGVFYAE